MRLLITGGCGFIGVNLIDYLFRNFNHSIVVLDNLKNGKKEYVAEYDVEFIKGDIRDKDLVDQITKKIDGIIHLAADTQVIPSISNPDFNFDVNVNGTYNLLRNARKNEVDRFIFASTGGAIIGDTVPPVNESMPPKPISPYGASKLCGEGYCSAFFGSYGIKTVSLRFSNVYGPRSYHKGSVVALYFKRIIKNKRLIIYGDGNQTRDFIYVDDISRAITNALKVEEGGMVFQLGTARETSVNELIEKISNTIGESYQIHTDSAPMRAGEVLRNYSDIALAMNGIDFKPKVGLSDGLIKTWQWFKLML